MIHSAPIKCILSVEFCSKLDRLHKDLSTFFSLFYCWVALNMFSDIWSMPISPVYISIGKKYPLYKFILRLPSIL
jgi:hypothetical protein